MKNRLLKILIATIITCSITISTINAAQPSIKKRGIDISEFQGNINWDAVKRSNQVDFVMLRTSWGYNAPGEGAVDTKLDRNIREANRVGIPIGAYHFCYAKNVDQAKKEASLFLSQLDKTRWAYPVCLDMEYSKYQGDLSKDELTNIAYTFMNIIEQHGYYVSLYANLNWLHNKFHLNSLDRFDKWVAQWHSRCEYSRPFGLWQYSNSGNIPGIDGNVDLNYAYKDYPAIISGMRLNGFH